MRWLVHGKVTSASIESLHRHEQETKAIELAADASPADVLGGATKAQLEIITTDSALIDAIYENHVPFKRVIVFLQAEDDTAIDRLFERYKRLSPGRMYTVTATRVKIRQLPTTNNQ